MSLIYISIIVMDNSTEQSSLKSGCLLLSFHAIKKTMRYNIIRSKFFLIIVTINFLSQKGQRIRRMSATCISGYMININLIEFQRGKKGVSSGKKEVFFQPFLIEEK